MNLVVDGRFQELVESKQRRKSPILRKCEDLMETLWEDGYRREIPWHTLKDYIVAMCGGFRTTITDYLGRRAKYYKSRGRSGILKTPAKKGYLEKFGFIEKKSPKIVFLHHEGVNRSYHLRQANISSFSLSNSQENRDGIKGVTNTATLLLHTQREREIKNFKQTLQNPTLTSEELWILKAATKRG